MDLRIALAPAVIALAGCIEAATPPPRAQEHAVAKSPDQGGPDFVAAAVTGDADGAVKSAMASAGDRRVVVYVGATWCEPCQYFHKAVEAGELDAVLPGVRFLEFDADRDGERLEAAGYGGRLIPRFALPGADGRFGGQKVEGGVKGDGAVDHILARLQPMLANARDPSAR